MNISASIKSVILCFWSCCWICSTQAAFLVTPSVFFDSEASASTVVPLYGDLNPETLQWVLPASDFSSVPIGAIFSSIGFRLEQRFGPQPHQATSFAQWNLQLSQATMPFPSLAENFADNIGADSTLVRSGSLDIPMHAFPAVNATPPNDFFDISFSTPHVYSGGDLVITLTHTGNDLPIAPTIWLDADKVVNGRGNSVGKSQFNATTGIVGFFNFPVVRFGIVPEPCTALLAVTAIIGMLIPKRIKYQT